MKRSLSPTGRWLLVGLSLSGLIISIMWRYIAAGFEADGSRISIVIVVLFAIGLLYSFLIAFRVSGERRRLEQLADQRRPEKEGGGIHVVFQEALHLVEQGDEVDFQGLMASYQERFMGSVRGVSVLSGVLITVGLLGTVVGLIITVSGISGVLNAVGQDYDMVVQGMNQTVEGMGSAFYTTFFGGLLGGVFLRILHIENYRSVTALLADCEQLAVRWIMPLSQRAARLTSGELDKTLADVGRMLTQFSDEVGAVSGSVAEGRAAIERQLQSVFVDARESFAKLMASELAELADGIRAMGHLLVEQQEPLRASLEEAQRSMGELVANQTERLSVGMASVANAVEEGQVPLRASLEEAQRSVGELVANQTERLSAGMASLANAVEEGQVPLRASLEEAQRSMAELVSRQLVELSTGLQGIVDTVEAGKAPLGAELEQLSSLVQASVERVEATVALAQRVNEEQRGQQTRELAERLQQAAALLRDISNIELKGDSSTGADGEAA